ncbi:uncharacterized protein LOC142609239 [Castanea sativa]|uniref:uncharacterized protein LOC142609239 n=1 Tax=Castanea sativa TaxID=21020 RepID=UPI003F6543C8
MVRLDNPGIGFSEEDARRLHHPHDDALVISIRAGDYNMHRVLVDNGSSADILYYPAFQQMGIGREGIEVNPEKVKAIVELSPPRTVKEVQSLNGKIAALNRFISRATNKCLPFFRTLKRSFEWIDECQKAFEDLKVYLSAPPLLSPSMSGEELFLYLAVSLAAISAALIREEDKVQRLVYFISRALRGVEERYPQMEKLAFALVTAAWKLKPYFQVHTINVLTDKPLRRAMSSPEAVRRMALWAIELSEFDIRYQPRAAVKGPILEDFIVEFTIIKDQGAEETPMWRVHTDGSSNKHAGGAGVVLHTPEGDKVECMIHLDFSTTNNEVEYEALIAGLDLAIAVGAKSMVVYSDSQVVTSQEENQDADRLAKAASAEPMIIPDQALSFVQLSSLLDGTNMQEVRNERCWMAPIAVYLKDGKLPDNKEDAAKLKVKAAWFVLIKDVLYKRGFSRPYLRCLGHEEADYVMREVHEGVCGNHSGCNGSTWLDVTIQG